MKSTVYLRDIIIEVQQDGEYYPQSRLEQASIPNLEIVSIEFMGQEIKPEPELVKQIDKLLDSIPFDTTFRCFDIESNELSLHGEDLPCEINLTGIVFYNGINITNSLDDSEILETYKYGFGE